MASTVEVRCLGGFGVTVGGVPVDRWRAGKARSLFQFLVVNRKWLRATVLHSLRTLREHASHVGDHLDVLTTCRRILELDPFAEDAYQWLMVWHAHRGELGRVRGWYDLCEGRLGERLDAEPSSRTKRILRDAMRRKPVSIDAPPGAAILAGTA